MVFKYEERELALSVFSDFPIAKKSKKTYVNLPMSFDIETTSFYAIGNRILDNASYDTDSLLYRGAVKCASMYVWQFAICDVVIIGRTWQQFLTFLDELREFFNCYENRYLIVYVHNLAYEFQFMRKWLKWLKVFSLDKRVPIRAETDKNIIFKCSYKLSGYSLDTVAKNLQKVKIKKLKGALNYEELRHSETVLTQKELDYCANDVLIVTAYIEEQIERWGGNIAQIPLTQTGAVRRFTRQNCFKYRRYKWLIKSLTFQVTEYETVKKAYAGGFVHCNACYTKQVLNDVSSFDFSSSYPSVMLAEKYPMTKGRYIHIETEGEILELAKNYALILDVKFLNVKSKHLFERILSISKCSEISSDYLVDNGRLDSATYLRTCVTEIDFINLKAFYSWEDMRIVSCVMYEKRYLPLPIIETVLELYEKKTTLKNVAGKEAEYLHSKELLNSVYGMCVTNIVRNEYLYTDDDWNMNEADVTDEINKYNNDKSRFLFYLWGVYITAYARRNLYSAILECKNDYVYSDTDSVKILNAAMHKKYFDDYNKAVQEKTARCLKWFNIPTSRATPQNKNGVIKPIGVWEYEGTYSKFKSLGAKRYLTEQDGKITATIAGLSKQLGRDYIASQEDPFSFFNDMMTIDKEHSGRLIHTYCDNGIKGSMIDLNGKRGRYTELSYVHLEQGEYNLSMVASYLDYVFFRARTVK